MTTIEHFDN